MKILTEKGVLDLTEDFSIQIDNKSPINNDQASQSVPVTVPATPNNARITDFPFRPDLAVVPMGGDAPCVVQDESYRRTGQMHVVSASKKDGITINIGFDNAEVYAKWKNSYMQELSDLPVIDYGSASAAGAALETLMANPGNSQDIAVFPVLVDHKVKNGVAYRKYLNEIAEDNGSYHLVYNSRTVNVLYNDTPVSTFLPTGYGCTAFLFVGKILEMLFNNLGYQISKNPFRQDPELARIVILNNTADAIVTGKLYYADLLPSITVEDFMQSMFVRFGMIYQLDNDTKTVRIETIRDILKAQPQINISDFKTALPIVTFTEKKQIKLTQGISFASDIKAERYEEFRKGQGNLTSCKVNDGTFVPTSMFIELRTGNIYKWDSENTLYNVQSASFFHWERKTKGVAEEDLVSVDEAVEMMVQDGAPMPKYMAGYTHKHTYIQSTDDSVKDKDDTETPLVFLLALPVISRQMAIANDSVPVLAGTIMPYDAAGERIKINNVDFSFSLLMTFNDGIFATFWQAYDAILRHSANEVETEIKLPAHNLMDINMLDLFMYEGQKLLPDTISFTLPGKGEIKALVKMRTTNLTGDFNLAEEQGIVSADDEGGGGGGQVIPETSYAWREASSTLEEEADHMVQSRLNSYNTTPQKGYDSRGNYCWYWYRVNWDHKYIDTWNYENPSTDTYLKENPPTALGQQTAGFYDAKVYYDITGQMYKSYIQYSEDEILPPDPAMGGYDSEDVYASYSDEFSYIVSFEAVEV